MSGEKAVVASKVLGSITLWIGEAINSITMWVGEFTWIEWMIILFISIVGFILLYLRSKVKDRVRPKSSYYRF